MATKCDPFPGLPPPVIPPVSLNMDPPSIDLFGYRQTLRQTSWGDFQGVQGKVRVKARGPETWGKGSQGPRAPIPFCSGLLAFPLAFSWIPWKSPQLACRHRHVFDLYASMSKYFCSPPGMTNLFSSKRLQHEHPACHDTMNTVRCHRTGERCGSCAPCM